MRRDHVLEVMGTLVAPWQEHYISYGADPKVDDYYHDLASAIAPLRQGWDAFPHNTRFGDIPFLTYINCIRVLMGFALKHIDFCILLCKQHPTVDPINVVTVPSEWGPSCEYMARALGSSLAEAEKVLQTTVVTTENFTHHIAVPAGPFAPHYKISDGSIIRLVTGCLEHPFLFLLRELKRRYPEDWDKSVDSREAVFRSELIALLTKFQTLAVLSGSVNITCSQGKTDIDFLAIDVAAGEAGIFQLKWQDHFGGSIRERESRKTNLLKNGNAWVERVCCWINEGGLRQALRSLGVPKKVSDSIRTTRLFVIGRNFSHFSGSYPQDSRAAWGSWSQVLRAMHTAAEGSSALSILHDLIVADSPITRANRPAHTQEICIDDWKWVIRPCRNWVK